MATTSDERIAALGANVAELRAMIEGLADVIQGDLVGDGYRLEWSIDEEHGTGWWYVKPKEAVGDAV